jgi:hypothetical protein
MTTDGTLSAIPAQRPESASGAQRRTKRSAKRAAVAVSAVTVTAACLMAAGCAGPAIAGSSGSGAGSQATSTSAAGGAGAGGGAGANSNPACAAVATDYSNFLAGYAPTKGGLWGALTTSLATQASGAGTAQLSVDITAVSQDAQGLVNPDNPSGYQGAAASQLEQFDSDLKTLATDCGIKLTPPVPYPANGN